MNSSERKNYRDTHISNEASGRAGSRYQTVRSYSVKTRRWGWLMVLFAVGANGLLFFSLSWMNRLPRNTPVRQSYAVMEVFPVELPVTPPLPMAETMPTVADNVVNRTEMETPDLTYETTDFTPRMADWLPQLPLIEVPLTLQTIALPATPPVPKATVAKPTGPLQLFQVDQLPGKVSGRLPSYPYWARARGAEGFVILRFVVDVQGKVGKMEVDQVVGDPRFADVAREAVAHWTFTPAIYNSKPVAVWCVQRIQFKLDK